jgi:hypothetical protein
MHHNIADVVIHIDQKLDDEQMNRLEQAFLTREGVETADFNPDNPHLILLKYDPTQISARDLIDIPRYQGLHGELIGF